MPMKKYTPNPADQENNNSTTNHGREIIYLQYNRFSIARLPAVMHPYINRIGINRATSDNKMIT